MTQILWHKKVWNGHSKGISTVLGTVFLTLVIFAISTNVFLWSISQNAQYTQAVKDENQKNVDRLSEHVIASGANYSVLGNQVTVKVTLRNAGSVAVHIINLWVFDTDPSNQRYTNKSLDLNLNPGEAWPHSSTVAIPEADQNHTFVSWFVTARGNTIPLETEQAVIVAQLAQGIGSIAMDFRQFRYYEVSDNKPGTDLGSPKYSFTVDGSKLTVFCVVLTNLDPSGHAINLTSGSCIWALTPFSGTVKGDSWPITKVQNNKLATFDFQVLTYNTPTEVYFGACQPKFVQGNVVPINILLFGKIGNDDYGQNIPFIALYITA